MNKSVEETNEYLKNYKFHNSYWRPKYHLTPKTGWFNDPHGFNHFNGEFHLFFQYSPYSLDCGAVYWGHVTTKDFIHFSDTEVVLSPTDDYDNTGCWSGSTIVKDDVLYIFYTGFTKKDDGKFYQTICVATSTDGYNFTKSDLNPVIGTDKIPAEADIYDFRDPCVFKDGEKYYIIIGSKNRSEHKSLMCLYESDDLLHWNFKKILVKEDNFGSMFECPNLIRYDNENYIVVSPQDVPMKDDNFYNVSSCIYFRLPKDFINKDVKLENPKEIDHGFDFYAPNVYDPEKITVGWQQLWGRRYYLKEINSDFINSFTLFKNIVRGKDHQLKFVPMDIYKSLFKNEEKHNFNLKADKEKIYKFGKYYHADVKVEVKEHELFKMKITKNGSEAVVFTLDVSNKQIIIDRTSLKEQLYGVDNTPATRGIRFLKLKELDKYFKFEIYVDHENIEVFVNDYKDSFTLLSFSDGEDFAVCSNVDTKVKIVKQDVVID